MTPRQQRRAIRKEEYTAKHKLAHLPIDSHGQVITPGYGRYKTSHDGSLYIPGVLQMVQWAKRPNDGPYKARGGKVTVVKVLPMV